VLSYLVGKELLSPKWAERILSWRHTGFNVHSRVRAKMKPEAERVGKYMIRPLLSLEQLSFLEREGKIGCGGEAPAAGGFPDTQARSLAVSARSEGGRS
jgi:hypothetical protein